MLEYEKKVVDQRVTFLYELMDVSGRILFRKGEVHKVEYLEFRMPFYGKGSGVYYPEKLFMIKIIGYDPLIFPRVFEEYKTWQHTLN